MPRYYEPADVFIGAVLTIHHQPFQVREAPFLDGLNGKRQSFPRNSLGRGPENSKRIAPRWPIRWANLSLL